MKKKGAFVTVVLLFAGTLISAVLVVYSKHQSRNLFVELQQLKSEVNLLNTEWGQLQLEQSAWSDHGRIERVAVEKLDMIFPDADKVIFIKP